MVNENKKNEGKFNDQSVKQNDKQVPINQQKQKENANISSKQPNFDALNQAKLPGPKEKNNTSEIKLTGDYKPTMDFGSVKTKSKTPKEAPVYPTISQSTSKPSLMIKNNPNLNDNKISSDNNDYRPRHEKIIEKAQIYINDDRKRTLEEMFDFNSDGTSILKEINDMLTYIMEKYKPRIIQDEKYRNKPMSAGTEEIRKKKKIEMYEKEYATGAKFLNNLKHELDELTAIQERISNPL